VAIELKNPFGVGSQMAYVFHWFLINATPDCPCWKYAQEYDEWGPDLCETNMDIILDRLAEESKIRKLPFNRLVANRFVLLCISRARRGRPIP
jgi:hypothetical protein